MSTIALNKRRVYYANNRGNKESYRSRTGFNCYGAVLFALGAMDKLAWVGEWYMLDWLNKHTDKIYRPRRKGDIISFHECGLTHTAVYLGKGKYFHKRGMNTAEITDLRGIRETYDGEIQFHKVKETI